MKQISIWCTHKHYIPKNHTHSSSPFLLEFLVRIKSPCINARTTTSTHRITTVQNVTNSQACDAAVCLRTFPCDSHLKKKKILFVKSDQIFFIEKQTKKQQPKTPKTTTTKTKPPKQKQTTDSCCETGWQIPKLSRSMGTDSNASPQCWERQAGWQWLVPKKTKHPKISLLLSLLDEHPTCCNIRSCFGNKKLRGEQSKLLLPPPPPPPQNPPPP